MSEYANPSLKKSSLEAYFIFHAIKLFDMFDNDVNKRLYSSKK